MRPVRIFSADPPIPTPFLCFYFLMLGRQEVLAAPARVEGRVKCYKSLGKNECYFTIWLTGEMFRVTSRWTPCGVMSAKSNCLRIMQEPDYFDKAREPVTSQGHCPLECRIHYRERAWSASRLES
jgi:hypothetical protein